MNIDGNKLAMGALAGVLGLVISFGFNLPTRLALVEERSAVLGEQLDETLDLVSALHPRGSARAGGPVDEDAEVRDVKIRDLMKRAPPPVVLIEGPPPSCPPCPCECPEPEPTPETTP